MEGDHGLEHGATAATSNLAVRRRNKADGKEGSLKGSTRSKQKKGRSVSWRRRWRHVVAKAQKLVFQLSGQPIGSRILLGISLVACSVIFLGLYRLFVGKAVVPRQLLSLRRPLLRNQYVSSLSHYEHHWPYSLRDHFPQDYETLVHPGDQVTELTVPKFWSPPLHENALLSRQVALQVGSCTTPDAGNHHHARGDECPRNERTILVMIASYRDYQCRETVESILTRARFPERIRIAVVDQVIDGMDVACDAPIVDCQQDPQQALCKYPRQVDVLTVDATLSLGPTFARHLGHRMYRGEYYVLQTDAHMTFVVDWDEDIVAQIESTHNEMAVLTNYPSDVKGAIAHNGHSLKDSRPVMCNSEYQEEDPNEQFYRHMEHLIQPELAPTMVTPQLEPWWAAGFSFARGHFVVNVPYDPWLPMIFMGEEMSMSVRGFTVGYDYYAPERSVCFHHYHRDESKVGYFNENEDRYKGLDLGAMKRLLGIIHANPELETSEWDHRDEEVYGLGGVRTPEMFYTTFGIDVMHKTQEYHLCKWVTAAEDSMHHQFTPHLRPDGMGIDYSRISFEFKDPNPDVDDDGADVVPSPSDDEAEESDEEAEEESEEENEV